ncbi:Shikimate kinase I [Methanosarcina siciliae T4/M]|uniref:Shikimate kinase I n=2 Tax=Methanosarcina siciliae TaxID=38027 RepID=A0A0E3PFQ4_9EURY|nr:shikimate kinase [Methanosarcina siciliae]AKB29535.1 Shikimate kinase I [Methanosarcina siciliae T4/M]AKB33470.1 Shikimate kinase I [Methanosarcina siciliae HI350]
MTADPLIPGIFGTVFLIFAGRKRVAMNITLIGMAGAGKSTIGKALAKRLDYTFIDVDGMITKKTGMPLQALIDKQGDSALIRFEEEAILELEQVDNCIISPGGSVVYSEKAMEHLKKISKIVFLDASFRSIVRRIPNARKRGIVGLRDRSLKELFEERLVLYKKYADFSIRLKGRENVQRVAGKIIKLCFDSEP